jgi:two-component system cell cycle sensor histidine kinase/response regulator CckA
MEKIEQSGSAVDLLVTDIRMPRMDGIALAVSVSRRHPGIPILFISGYPLDLEEQRKKFRTSLCAFLSKPFTTRVLVETVEKCLAGHRRGDAALK